MPTTTHPTRTPASSIEPAPLSAPDEAGIDTLDERSRRARTEPMAVESLGHGLYEVRPRPEAEAESYLVALDSGRCTCPDHVFRGVRCKHLRRVAMEITERRAPPPGEISVACADPRCDDVVFVDEGRENPVYCGRHELGAGDAVRDDETGALLTVVDVSGRRADAVRIPAADATVSTYPTNADYAPDEPVVAAIYPHATIGENGPVPNSLDVYVFPRSRLRRVRPPESDTLKPTDSRSGRSPPNPF